MNTIHRYLGFAVMGLFLVFWVWGAIARWRKVLEPGKVFWALLAVVQVAIGLQALGGLILLVTGHVPSSWLHYVYGFGPIIVLVLAHLYARSEKPQYRYAPFVIAGVVAWGLALRAIMTGLGM